MNALLSESLLQTHCFSHAAIIKRKDLVIKARTPNWPIARDELDKVAALFDHPSVAREQGVTVGGCPFRVVRADQTSIYGKVDEEGVNTLGTLGTPPSGVLGHREQQQQQGAAAGGGGNLTVGGGNAANVKASGQQLGGQGGSGSSPPAGGGAAGGQEQGSERSEKDKTVVEVIRPPISSSLSSKRYDGIILCRTGMYVLIGIYDRHPGMAVEAMERLADWFRSKHR